MIRINRYTYSYVTAHWHCPVSRFYGGIARAKYNAYAVEVPVTRSKVMRTALWIKPKYGKYDRD